MIATPVVYGDSGNMTFYTNAKSTVWQIDEGKPIISADIPKDGVDAPRPFWSITGY